MEMQKIYLWENEKDVPLFDAGIGQEMPSITPFLLNDGKGHGAMRSSPPAARTPTRPPTRARRWRSA